MVRWLSVALCLIGLSAADCSAKNAPFTKADFPRIDDEHLVNLAIMVAQAPDGGEALCATLNSYEQAALPVITGFAFANAVKDNVLESAENYNIVCQAIETIEETIAHIEENQERKLLYFNISSFVELMPAKYYLASTMEIGKDFHGADSVYILMAQDVGRDFGTDSNEFVYWTNHAAAAINNRYKDYTRALEVMTPALHAALNSRKVSKATSFEFLVAYAQKKFRAGAFADGLKYALIASPKAEEPRQIYQVSRLLGELYASSGDGDEAEKCFARAASNSPSLPEFLANSYCYADLLRQNGKTEEALSLLEDLKKYMESPELDAADKFQYYEMLGVTSTFLDPDKSKEAFVNAEKYLDGIDYSALIRHIINSQIYPNEENSFAQISALDRIWFIYNTFVKNDPRLLVEIEFLFGDYYLKIKDYQRARTYLTAAFTDTLDFADSDPFIVRILRDLNKLFKQTEQPKLWKVGVDEMIRVARPMGTDSYRYLEAVAAAMDYALTTNDLAAAEQYLQLYSEHRNNDFDTECYRIRLDIATRRFAEAEERLKGLESSKRPDEPNLANLWEYLYSEMEHPDVAKYARRNFENYREEILRQLLFMSSAEQHNLLEELTKRRDRAIELIAISPGMVDVAFDYSLLIKGLLLSTQSSLRKYLSNTAEAREDWNRLQVLYCELQRSEAQGDESACANLRGEIDSRERYILNDYVDFRLFRKGFDARTVKAIKETRPANAALADFVAYTSSDGIYYGVFVVDSIGESHFESIGHSSLIEPWLYRAWQSISPYFADGADVYFCPDGRLASLPLEYAADGRGRSAADRFRLHRVFHLADLPTPQTIGDRPVAVGVEDHNSPMGKADNLTRGNWTDIPQVKTEIAQFRTLLAKKKPMVLFNDNATETRVKELDGSDISTLHISTHGFFRDRNSLMAAAADELSPDMYVARRALSAGKTELSGLVLRGGNLAWKSEHVSANEDNLLTADEISTMTFPALRLVVLSACETGLGQTDAEGVWGLQRAFRMAGARSIICTLEKVSDYWTTQFMEEFYTNAATGHTLYDSFHAARRALLSVPECPPSLLNSLILIE